MRIAFRPCLTAIVLVLAGACSSGDKTDPAPSATPAPLPTVQQMAERGPYGVGVITLDLVDASRPTEANRDYAGAPDRALPTNVWYPADVSAETPEQQGALALAADGPYPLILFAHGFSSFRRQSASYMQHLASHGYVVAAMDFPGTNIVAGGGPRLYHVLDQPADVSFVIDELQSRDAEPDWTLAGLIDFDNIGLTGHSLGGLTVMLAAYGERADPRIDAIVPISPPACFLPDDLARNASLPAMIIGGSKELIVSPSWIALAYEIASPPKYYANIIGADHIRFGDFDITDDKLGNIVDRASGGDTVADFDRIFADLGSDAADCTRGETAADEMITGDRQRELMRIAATPFFDAYLKGDAAAIRFLTETLPTLDGMRFQSDLLSPGTTRD
jgi:predicted dienelactone hydrolase